MLYVHIGVVIVSCIKALASRRNGLKTDILQSLGYIVLAGILLCGFIGEVSAHAVSPASYTYNPIRMIVFGLWSGAQFGPALLPIIVSLRR